MVAFRLQYKLRLGVGICSSERADCVLTTPVIASRGISQDRSASPAGADRPRTRRDRAIPYRASKKRRKTGSAPRLFCATVAPCDMNVTWTTSAAPYRNPTSNLIEYMQGRCPAYDLSPFRYLTGDTRALPHVTLPRYVPAFPPITA
jgi:hypothetical protein